MYVLQALYRAGCLSVSITLISIPGLFLETVYIPQNKYLYILICMYRYLKTSQSTKIGLFFILRKPDFGTLTYF